MFNTITYFTNDASQALKDCKFEPVKAKYDTINSLESVIRSAKTLVEELRKNTWSETNVYHPERRFRKPSVTKVANADGDVLLTVLRDLHDTREDIINGCTCKDALSRVDTLIDNIENYMAEA